MEDGGIALAICEPVAGVEQGPPEPMYLCKHQLEHEGGAFWCSKPIGHSGPHDPPPHEAGITKRPRAPPKRLSDEPEQTKKKITRREVNDEAEDHDTGPRNGSRNAGSRQTPKASRTGGGPHSPVRSSKDEPGGCARTPPARAWCSWRRTPSGQTGPRARTPRPCLV